MIVLVRLPMEGTAPGFMTKLRKANMKKPYYPPEIDVYPTLAADLFNSSALPVGEAPEEGFGEIKFF